MKLAVVSTHPIQYNAPWFQLLSEEEGVEVKVFYTWEQSETSEKYDPGFGRVVKWDIPLLTGYDYSFVKNISTQPGSHHFKGIDNPSLNKEIENWGAEAVLVFGWAFKSHLKCLRYFKNKIPVLFRGDSTLLDEQGGLKRMLRRMFLKYVYSFIDYALYVGQNNKDYFLAHGVKERQLVFTPHAVDNERFSKNSDEQEQAARKWRTELGIKENDTVLLFAGKFNKKKNPFFLIELAKLLGNDNLKFVFVGNGELEEELKTKVSEDDRFIFLGFQNQTNMPVVYRLADIFVLPSVGPGETWGLAINEAMACGRAVITTHKTGCAPDMITEGKNGVVVDIDGYDKAAKFVQSYMQGDTLKKSVKAENIAKLNIYSFSSIVSTISKLLKSSK